MVQSETLRVVYCEPAFFLFLGGGGGANGSEFYAHH